MDGVEDEIDVKVYVLEVEHNIKSSGCPNHQETDVDLHWTLCDNTDPTTRLLGKPSLHASRLFPGSMFLDTRSSLAERSA
ncbi:hypothetical protein PM082_001756 [Marasmius tenuissimus]|nr:hypothetical protein PM082_001756 [Marasmius tenuissimus]